MPEQGTPLIFLTPNKFDKNKKAWSPYLLLAPRLEALALPILLEQAT